MLRIQSRITAFVLCLLLTAAGSAQAGFSNVYIFGDSLSDNGNLAAVPDYEFLLYDPYDAGFSNGPRAVEVLADYLELPADPALYLVGPTKGTNYAVAGARAAGTDVIDLKAQVTRFMYDMAGNIPSDALYVMAVGGNDVRDARDESNLKTARSIITQAADAIYQDLRKLVTAGAKAIMIINSPDIGSIPETHLIAELTGDQRIIHRTTLLTEEFNRKLTRKLNRIEHDFHIDLVQFDLFSFFNFFMENNEALGFTNTTDACFSSVTFTYDPECLDGAAFDQFMFFDEIHPTARLHQRTGRALFSIVPEPPQ